MKKDIDFSPVKNVHVIIAKEDETWRAHLVNRRSEKLENIMITSRGYGETNTEQQKTSTLRHMIPYLVPGMSALVEPIDASVFHLTNEYWVSYYINGQIYDKKFVFLPDTILEKNLSYIPELDLHGILHD